MSLKSKLDAGEMLCTAWSGIPDALTVEIVAAQPFDAVTLDELAARTGIAPAELSARLLELELAGDVARLPGQRIQRLARA